jgi:hypothetical protein
VVAFLAVEARGSNRYQTALGSRQGVQAAPRARSAFDLIWGANPGPRLPANAVDLPLSPIKPVTENESPGYGRETARVDAPWDCLSIWDLQHSAALRQTSRRLRGPGAIFRFVQAFRSSAVHLPRSFRSMTASESREHRNHLSGAGGRHEDGRAPRSTGGDQPHWVDYSIVRAFDTEGG